jgi:cell division protein FtsB
MHEERPSAPARSTVPAAPPGGAADSLPRRLLSPFVLAILAAFLILLAAGSYKTWRDLVTVEARADELRQEVARTESEIQTLESRLQRLQNDPATLERLARQELAMVYPQDIVLVLPPDPPPLTSPAGR